MRRALLPIAAAFLMLSTTAAMAQAAAEVKIGTAVEKAELQGAAESFKVAAGTKLYAWTKVSGCEGSKITVVFLKADKEVSKVELEVPRSPYRTNAYRTFRAGDGGAWAASVRSADGKELGKATFTVEVN